MRFDRPYGIVGWAICLLIVAGSAPLYAEPLGEASPTQEVIEPSPGNGPAPVDPYPLNAAGWGPMIGKGLFASRWVEDWTALGQNGKALPLKAMPLGGDVFLTLGTEIRQRNDIYLNGQSKAGNDYLEGVTRAILGTDLRWEPNLNFYAEIGTGQVEYPNGTFATNYQNEVSVQQLLLDIRGFVGPVLAGAVVGRQEFADGPPPLLSLGDGANLHRTWNGVRFYLHGQDLRLGGFDLRATLLEPGAFDETINDLERLQGLNASLSLSLGPEWTNLFLDPFWFHTENPVFRVGSTTGLDDRNTYGARLWGRRGALGFDWTLAYQDGRFMNRPIDAWGLFAVESLALSDTGWKPRLGAHIDVATGGGAYGTGTLQEFNQLYAASTYLSEGLFLSTSNLLMIAPGISVTPTTTTKLSMEYGFASRLWVDDFAFSGKMSAYAGTQNVPGSGIGGLLRATGNWAVTDQLNLFFTFEYLSPGEVLARAIIPGSSYSYVGGTFRY